MYKIKKLRQISIVIIKTCKCGIKFQTKPSDKRISCNKCLIGETTKQRIEDLKMVDKVLKRI